MDRIRIVLKNPLEPPRILHVEPSLEALQGLVGGFLELVGLRVGGERFDLFCNEEGRLRGLLPNLSIGETDFLGPVFVACSDEDGETIGLTEEQAAEWSRLLSGQSSTRVHFGGSHSAEG